MPAIMMLAQREVDSIASDKTMFRRLTECLGAICFLTIVLRIYVRQRIIRKMHADDYLMVLAFLLFTGLIVANSKANGDDTDGMISTAMRSRTVAAVLYPLSATFAKGSLVVFLQRILDHDSRYRRAIMYFILLVTVVFAIVAMAFGLTCGTNAGGDDPAHCSMFPDTIKIDTAFSIVSMTCDLTFAACCASMILRAMMPLRTKLIATTLLSFGSLGAIASALRVDACLRPAPSIEHRRMHVMFFGALEVGICIAAASLATLRPLIEAGSTWMVTRIPCLRRREEQRRANRDITRALPYTLSCQCSGLLGHISCSNKSGRTWSRSKSLTLKVPTVVELGFPQVSTTVMERECSIDRMQVTIHAVLDSPPGTSDGTGTADLRERSGSLEPYGTHTTISAVKGNETRVVIRES